MPQLYDSITNISGVGAKRQKDLAELGINTIEDLLTYYPFRYEDIQEKNLLEIQDQAKVTLKGIVVSEPVVSHYGYRKSRLNFQLLIDHAVIRVTFFNQPYLKEQIHASEELAVFGKWDGLRKSLTGIKVLGNRSQQEFAPIYHVNKHIRQASLVKLIQQAFEEYGNLVPEILPVSLLNQYQLMPRAQAMYAMHFPKNNQENQQARQRIIFEEFFLYQWKMQGLRKQVRIQNKGASILYNVGQLKQFTQNLPFELTPAQKRVTNEICRDLRLPIHMHRLLQGDVGSGKTVVAAIALYACVTAGMQGALMVPTEILAQQHMESLTSLFENYPINIGLLTSSTKAKDRKALLANLVDGSLNLIIGTHALIQEDVQFNQLGLVITDEQHRFGVKQRQVLREKGLNPDVLFMTATPIPRTLAITAFGEMDVSVIDELPAGRIPIETRWIRSAQLDTVLNWCKKELTQKHQIYVICPLIEESEAIDVKNATEIYEHLQDYFAPNYQVALLHGKMKPKEKEAIMLDFKQARTQVLVSTTVIEVGVNVPNATVMLIMDADRFGLAQLHQLRGRVGRGQMASYCILVADPKNEMGKERMKIMTETTNGFKLSEEDLKMRGPGEVFGSKQSGVPEFKVGDIVEDLSTLELTRTVANELYQTNWKTNIEFQELIAYLNNEQLDSDYFD